MSEGFYALIGVAIFFVVLGSLARYGLNNKEKLFDNSKNKS